MIAAEQAHAPHAGYAPRRAYRISGLWLAVALAAIAALSYVLIELGVLAVGDLQSAESPSGIVYVAAGGYLLGGLLILLRRRWLWTIGAVMNALVLLSFVQMYQNRPAVLLSPGGLASKAAQVLLEVTLISLIFARRDGLPGYIRGAGDLASYIGPLVVRWLDVGKGQARQDRERALAAPALVVLGTDIDTPAAWLGAGASLARLLLAVQAEGVSAGFLNQPIQVATLRPRLRGVLGRAGFPQLLLRLGYAPPARPTPRRPVEEVTERGSPATVSTVTVMH